MTEANTRAWTTFPRRLETDCSVKLALSSPGMKRKSGYSACSSSTAACTRCTTSTVFASSAPKTCSAMARFPSMLKVAASSREPRSTRARLSRRTCPPPGTGSTMPPSSSARFTRWSTRSMVSVSGARRWPAGSATLVVAIAFATAGSGRPWAWAAMGSTSTSTAGSKPPNTSTAATPSSCWMRGAKTSSAWRRASTMRRATPSALSPGAGSTAIPTV